MTRHSAFTIFLIVFLGTIGGRAATLPVAEDSSSTRGRLTALANAAGSLRVDASHTGYVYFNLAEVPVSQAAQIRYARLRLYLPRVTRAGGGIEVRVVTSSWDEATPSVQPSSSPASVPLTIVPHEIASKRFVSVDVTSVVQAWVSGAAANEGFALAALKGTSLLVGAKEGSGSGYPAELEVELNPEIAPGSITGAELAPGSVQAAAIAAGAVGSTQLAHGAVGTEQIANGAITAAQIAGGSITGNELAAGSVTPDRLAKPTRSGLVSSSTLTVDPAGGTFIVPFSPGFSSPPVVTLTMDAADGSVPGKARVSLTSREPGQFTARISPGTSAPLTSFTTTVLDGTGGNSVGVYSSTEIVNGSPAIAYYDTTAGDLKFVRAIDSSGSTWGTPIVVESPGNVGQWPSLALVNGNPAISYWDVTNGNLKYIRASDPDGSVWSTSIVIDHYTVAAGFPCSLLVVNGKPAIAYYDPTNGDLRYVRASDDNGASWSNSVRVDGASSSVGVGASMAIVNGRPAIGYFGNNQSDRSAFYVRALDADGATWGTPVTVVGAFVTAGYTSLSVVNGKPAMAINNGSGSLSYARGTDQDGAAWAVTIQANSGSTQASLKVISGNPAIAWTRGAVVNFLRALDPDGLTWGATVAVGNFDGTTGVSVSLSQLNGNPAITFHDSGALEIARAADFSGREWRDPQILDGAHRAGSDASLGVVNGNPAIAYKDNSLRDLRYVRALDKNGTAWAPSIALDGFGDVGSSASLAIIAGNPAVSYYDATSADLKYVRANDPAGGTWDVPVRVQSTGDVGKVTTLAEVNGWPAIAYYDTTNAQVKYIRANDATGSTWPVAPQFATASTVGDASTLLVVNGNPAISLADGRYVRSNDADGANWGTPVATGLVRSGTMVIVAGRPAVSNSVSYVRANDADGTSWGAVVDYSAATGTSPLRPTAMALINGLPAAAAVLFDRSYARAIDAEGEGWSDVVQLPVSVGTIGALAEVNGQPAVAWGNGRLNFTRAKAALPFNLLWIALEP